MWNDFSQPICIFLMDNDAKHLFMYKWQHRIMPYSQTVPTYHNHCWMNITKNEAKKRALKDIGFISYDGSGKGTVVWGRIFCKYEAMYFDPSRSILLPLNHVPFGASLPRGWAKRPVAWSLKRKGNIEERKKTVGSTAQICGEICEIVWAPL